MIKGTFRLTAAAITLVMLCFASQPATAFQPSPEDLLLRLDGLESAYARKYIADSELGFVTPVISDSSTPSVLLVTVLEFDTAESVTENVDSVMNGLTAKMIIGNMDIDLDVTEIDDLGDQAELYTGEIDDMKDREQVMLLVVQDGNLAYLITAWGTDVSIESTVMNVGEFMVDAEPGTDASTPQAPAATTGGTFDVMPSATESDLLNGLIPMYDYDLLLNGGTEPIDHIATPTD